ncbi:MAG: hypothetical protein KIT27_05560 [Legionellales bacterium]|nr:hypothetical protein [Legionellales bacterium]
MIIEIKNALEPASSSNWASWFSAVGSIGAVFTALFFGLRRDKTYLYRQKKKSKEFAVLALDSLNKLHVEYLIKDDITSLNKIRDDLKLHYGEYEEFLGVCDTKYFNKFSELSSYCNSQIDMYGEDRFKDEYLIKIINKMDELKREILECRGLTFTFEEKIKYEIIKFTLKDENRENLKEFINSKAGNPDLEMIQEYNEVSYRIKIMSKDKGKTFQAHLYYNDSGNEICYTGGNDINASNTIKFIEFIQDKFNDRIKSILI